MVNAHTPDAERHSCLWISVSCQGTTRKFCCGNWTYVGVKVRPALIHEAGCIKTKVKLPSTANGGFLESKGQGD